MNPDTLEAAWADGDSCPSGMKYMPQVRFSIRYDVKSITPDGWDGAAPFELACGASHCMHGDFINGWLPETAEKMVTALTSERSFQYVNYSINFILVACAYMINRALDGPNGKTRAGSICTGTAVDHDPDNGTDDYETSLDMMGGSASNSTGLIESSVSTPTVTAPTAVGPVSAAADTISTPSCTAMVNQRSIGKRSKRAFAHRAVREM